MKKELGESAEWFINLEKNRGKELKRNYKRVASKNLDIFT
jgi:hypothetical protein